jgi:hypothetical protein
MIIELRFGTFELGTHPAETTEISNVWRGLEARLAASRATFREQAEAGNQRTCLFLL